MEICSSMPLQWLSKLHIDRFEQKMFGGKMDNCYIHLYKSVGIFQKDKNRSDI